MHLLDMGDPSQGEILAISGSASSLDIDPQQYAGSPEYPTKNLN
jgi:hypothetical protein